MSDTNKACVVGHFEELWNRGDIERVGDFFSTEFTNFGRPVPDVQAILGYVIGTWRTAFPDLNFSVDSMIAEDDIVMCEATLRGTHAGVFHLVPPLEGPNLPPNGKSFQVKHIHRFRLRDGKIVEHFAVRDDLGMFQQLGHLRALSS